MTQRERRRFPRAQEPIEAQYRLDGDFASTWTTATILNLSAGGVRFRAAQPLNAGALLQMKLRLPGMPQLLELRGAVVWSQLQAATVMEYGVEFRGLTLRQQAQIDQLVSFLRTRL
ncbi:MAG: PilZ domain-containing protein [Candidatus Omnitrophica bacterium]|nr:PilZ domain-containing protein [Candidatus Omnitrophota bacterium]